MRLQNNDFARIKRACGYNAPGMMQLSEIGGHLTARTGIDDLMEDLFKALHSGDPGLCQLNGGSPAVIPEVTELWRRSMTELVRDGRFDQILSPGMESVPFMAVEPDRDGAVYRNHVLLL